MSGDRPPFALSIRNPRGEWSPSSRDRRGPRLHPRSPPTFRSTAAVDWQHLIVALVVLWAAVHLGLRALRLWRPVTGGSCARSCTGCESSSGPPLVTLDVPPATRPLPPLAAIAGEPIDRWRELPSGDSGAS